MGENATPKQDRNRKVGEFRKPASCRRNPDSAVRLGTIGLATAGLKHLRGCNVAPRVPGSQRRLAADIRPDFDWGLSRRRASG